MKLFSRACIILVLAIGGGSIGFADESVSYDRDIRPLLSSRCFSCHGPDSHSRAAGLRLDQADGPEGAIGFVIEPGYVEDSELWARIISEDESDMMPPPEAHLKSFNEEERDLIRRWIESGAEYEGFWAFEPPEKAAPPVVAQSKLGSAPIDRFVEGRLEAEGKSAQPEADPRTLIRRVTFDLIGLPPTREEIAQFETAYAADPEAAWESLVDGLLQRPQFGEHVGRYWLDLVRFADSNGMHKDFYRNHVAYRDWVIRSFNENLGYDDFLKFQLAGDLFTNPTDDQLVASGFHRLHLIIDAGTALPEESHSKNVIDRVTSVGTAFLGLTIQCAQCHDHKYDPITQKDFYAMSSFFNNIDAAAETPGRTTNGLQEPFITLGSRQQKKNRAELEQQINHLQKQVRNAKKGAEKSKLEAELKVAKDNRREFLRTQPHAMVMKERDEVRPTYILELGQYDSPGEEVQRNTPEFLPPLETESEIPSRMDLANWFVDSKNPLTARVAVNRIWQQFFGVGLVKTSEDLGNQGEVPSHPELLDYLAVSFVESDWNVKDLMKQIAMSKTYRQSSVVPPEEYQSDPENRRLARGSRYRLDAEMIRDQILSTSGLLSEKSYGPSVKPPQPPGLWKAVSMIGETYQSDQGEDIYRRSVYTFWKRSMPHPQLTIFNAPIRDACVARRERTNTPLQALLLLNEPEYLGAARQLAIRTLQQPSDDRVGFIWETVTGQLPDAEEQQSVKQLLADLRKSYRDSPELLDDLCAEAEVPAELNREEVAAWTVVGNLMYSLDITKTKN